MKLAILANLDKEVSPNSRGGSEVFTYYQATYLAKFPEVKSIDVYGVGQNYFRDPKIRFVSLIENSSREYIEQNKALHHLADSGSYFLSQFEYILAIKLYKALLNSEYGLIQNNSTNPIINSLIDQIQVPVITTLHTNLDSGSIVLPDLLEMISQRKKHVFVTISQQQNKLRLSLKKPLNIAANILNGIDIRRYTPNSNYTHQNYALWIGRVSRKHNKGLKEAIIACSQAQKQLIAIVSVDDPEFYSNEIKPQISSYIKVIDQKLSSQEIKKYYQNAHFLLYPIAWEEPFGLVFLEAMASGTPVVAFARGAVPEVIKDGLTGFIVNPTETDIRGNWIIDKYGLEGIKLAIQKISLLSQEKTLAMRKASRKHVEDHFTIDRMAKEYLVLYQKMLSSKAD